MRKYAICSLLFILSFMVGASNVKAVQGIAWHESALLPTGVVWHETGVGGRSGTYSAQRKYMKINGQDFMAYCLDPGLDLNSGDSYTCTPVSDSGAAQIINSGADYTMTQMALRFYAVFRGYGSSTLTTMRAAMIRFVQLKNGVPVGANCEAARQAGLINFTCSNNAYDYLSGNISFIDTAYNMAHAAVGEYYKTDANSSGGLTFTKTAESSKDLLVYNVTALQNINKVKFVCDGCTIVGSDENWSGRSGQLMVRPAPDCEPFTIKAYYVPKGLQMCHTTNTSVTAVRQYLIVDFEAKSELSSDEIDTSGEPSQIHTDRGIECDEECCKEKDLEANHIEGDINNCCLDDTHSEAKEYDLNDLVCYSKDLLVDHYWKMCKSETYIDQKMQGELNEYCDIYCTERVTVDIPNAITATSGRYFELTKTAQGTKSPYVEGFKRCRTLIHFKKWQDKYRKVVEEQVKQYNAFQEARLKDLTYEDAMAKTRACSLTITVDCTGEKKTESKSAEHDPVTGQETAAACSVTADTTGHTASHTFGATAYTEYQFTNPAHNGKSAHSVKLDRAGFKPDADGYYNFYKVLYDKSTPYTHRNLSLWSTLPTINSANSKKSTEEAVKDTQSSGRCSATAGVTCTITYNDSCGHNSEGDHTSLQEDVSSVHGEHHSDAATALSLYQAAVIEAKTLEEQLDKCDNYFTEYGGANAEENFPFNAAFFGFEYTQVYVSDYGDLKKDVTMVPFDSAPGCEISGPFLGPDADDGLVDAQYSTKYHSDDITETEDFGVTGIEWLELPGEFEGYIDELYEADQKFVQDAKYKATCSWNEPANTKYTLVQRGSIQESDFNVTKNDKQYQIYLSTLEGQYDTRWLLSGLGTNSKFDAYFAENGKVCSGRQDAKDDGLLHCALKVEYEIISIGKCNGDETTTEVDECEITPGDPSETVLNFKVVDPATVFTCNSTEECGYGYNWFDMPSGQRALDEIRAKGREFNTYNPENLTYQVNLASADMRQIKNYNRYRENNRYGGYSDFSLICDCPDSTEECNTIGGGNQTCQRSSSCTQCRSIFLGNLYDGYVNYGANHNVSRAIGNLDSIRNSGHVHWAGR